MLAIKKRDSNDKCVPNILPCRISHNGPTKVKKRYWAVQKLDDGTTVTHFRGRRLKGKAVALPKDYQGIVMKTTENTLHVPPVTQNATRLIFEEEESGEDDQEEIQEPIQVLEQVSSFSEMMVWDHDQTPAVDDTFVKGIEEWISFAEAIHKPNALPDA